tara:strand:- start:120 stop:1220 length:1101 start_codon:yes stop_codon:yes gene_type:complete
MTFDPKWRDAAEVSTAGFHLCARAAHVSLGRADQTLRQPYWQQGDAALESAEAKAKRAALRSHPRVREALKVWWDTAERCSDAPASRSPGGGLLRTNYLEHAKRCFKAMIEQWDEAAALASADEDWQRDVQGGASLSRARFEDSMFELADTWAFDIDGDEYASLLWELFSCVTHGATADDSVWKQLEDISFLGQWRSGTGYGRFDGPPGARFTTPGAEAEALAREKQRAEAAAQRAADLEAEKAAASKAARRTSLAPKTPRRKRAVATGGGGAARAKSSPEEHRPDSRLRMLRIVVSAPRAFLQAASPRASPRRVAPPPANAPRLPTVSSFAAKAWVALPTSGRTDATASNSKGTLEPRRLGPVVE